MCRAVRAQTFALKTPVTLKMGFSCLDISRNRKLITLNFKTIPYRFFFNGLGDFSCTLLYDQIK